jgi:hypothetical protein
MVKQAFRGRQAARQQGQRGQSMVEFALSLPVLLLIVAGVLEVGNILTQYNRVQLAAREGARFGAEGGTDDGVSSIVKQTALGSFSTDEADMSIWVVRPIIDTQDSTNPALWSWVDWAGEEKHVYGTYATDPLDGTTVLGDLSSTSTYTDAKSLDTERFVVVVVRYEVPTLLNLSFFQIPGESGGRVPVWAYAILRQEIEQTAVSQAAGGCSAYPIAIDESQIAGLGEDDPFTLSLNNPAGTPTDEYGFLSWNVGYWLASDLNTAMTFPGNSLDGTEGFIEYGDPDTDTQMNRGDLVLSNPGGVADASTAISGANGHITKNRAIRVILYKNPPTVVAAYPTYYQYEISGFAIVRISSTSGNDITFKYVRTDYSCGF